FQYLGSGIWQPLTPSPGDNGQGLTNLDASGLTSGTVPLAQLPAAVVTNNEIGVTLSGTFSGNVATLSSGQTFTGSNTFQVVDSYGGVRITDGSTNSNVSIQPLASPNSGFQAINFNGYYDNGEHQYNSSKARWRIFVDQRGPGDSFNIDEYYSGALNIFMNIQTNGNMGIGTNAPVYPLEMASGAYVSAAGVWTSVSDRNVKEDFTTIQPEDVLDRLVAMPITQWRYKVEPDGTKHIGPMAQDFYAAFGLGQNNKAIGSIDEDGVALAAIQGLNQKLHSVKTQNAALKQQSDSLAEQLDELKAEVKALKQRQ
ncbi:MAG TPA: tail fiber domain-containing protein, partial [Verrucomicrobiae bacterium]